VTFNAAVHAENATGKNSTDAATAHPALVGGTAGRYPGGVAVAG